MQSRIKVLRYGHRELRDFRVTTHCALVSRALGAEEIIIQGKEDEKIINNIKQINQNFGSEFKIRFIKNWKPEIKKLKKENWKLIHLTMYGKPITEKIEEIKKEEKIIILIGSQKVEREVYEKADFNVAVTNQPHSEIASLAITLNEIYEGKKLNEQFIGAKKIIIPQTKGKKIIEKK